MAKKENRHAEHFDKLSASLVSASANIEAPYELPEGWKWCRLGDVADWGSGGTPSRKNPEYYNGSIPWIKTGELNESYIFDSEEKISEEAINHSSAKLFPKETVVLAMYGATIGKTAIFGIDASTNQACACAICHKDLDNHYLFNFLKSKKDYFIYNAKGGAQPNISQEIIKDTIIPLPPTLAEQQRIVNRIETMFAKLDQAQEKAQSVLDSFETRKAAILYKAFTGQLKIDNEELKIEDREVRELDVDFDIVSGIQKTPSRVPKNNPVPYLTVANVFRDRIDLSEVRYFEVSDAEVEKLKLIEKDILVVEGNGSGNEIGRCAMWRNEIPVCVHQNQIIRLRKKTDSVLPEYVLLYLNSSEGKEIMKEKAKTTAGLYNLSAGKIKTISVPYPPLNYQLSIVNFLDTVLEKESRAKEAAGAVLDQIDLLKKSILARAFRGEL